LQRPVRNVACWLDFHSLQSDHLGYSFEYAYKLNAKLHLLHTLPMIDEGMLSLGIGEKALEPGKAAEEILRLCANAPLLPEVRVARGSGRTTLAGMLRDCDADVVFLRNEEPVMAEWLGLGLRLCDGLPCPAICTGDELRGPVWNLEAGQTSKVISLSPELAVAAGGFGRGR
jgi:hypothetical protein